MIYLGVISLTVLFVYLGGKSRGLLKYFLYCVGLFLPCFLAACRDENIGVDVLAYAKWMYLAAQNTPFAEYLQLESKYASIGWNILSWITVRVFQTFPAYLFCVEAFCIIPVFIGLHRICKDNEWVGILPWLLLVYPASMNVMRQSIAMGFVFLAVSFIYERRPKVFTLLIFLAFLFHQTAIVCIALYPFSKIVAYGESFSTFFGKWRWLMLAVFIALLFGMSIALGPFFVKSASFFKESYSYQVNHLGSKDFSLGGFYLLLSTLLCWFVSRNDFDYFQDKGCIHERLISTYAFVVLGCLFTQLNLVASTLGRFGNYGYMLLPYLACYYMNNGSKSKGHLMLLILITLIYFVVLTLFMGKSGVYPYSSQILGIE